MRRSLTHYWRTHLAVVFGAAVTTAVLAGALIVGDSLRGSLRELALERLGDVSWAVVGERPFRASLGQDLANDGTNPPVPALTLRTSVTHPDSGARASEVALWGVDQSFFELDSGLDELDLTRRIGAFPPAAMTQALASELSVNEGNQLVLSFQRPSDIPRETVVGREESAETIEVLRVNVASILPNRSLGGFGLSPRQTRPLNVFVDLERLQRSLFGRGVDKLNVLLGSDEGEEELTARVTEALRTAMELDDLGLELKSDSGVVTLQSQQFVIDDARAKTVSRLADERGIEVQPVITYLANKIISNDRLVPYSTISALDPPAAEALGRFSLVNGEPVPALASDEILLNKWAADDLAISPGESVEIEYFVLGDRDELSTATRSFTLRGVVALEGLAIDPHLTPDFPGIEDADDISAWDPPFPVELDLIRQKDEDYWDTHRAAPKAFLSAAAGKELWSSRFGSLTSMRLAAAGLESNDLTTDLSAALRENLDPGSAGLAVRALRRDGLRAAKGATDFAGLFLGLSLFLIASAALLAGLLFRLGVEQRASELGLLRAVGFPAKKVRRRFMGEGLALAIVGSFLGLVGGVGYAWALLAALRSWWLPAIGEPILFLHVSPTSLVLGALISTAVVALAIFIALRKLGEISIIALLKGAFEKDHARQGGRSRWVALLSFGAALALGIAAFSSNARGAAGLAFGVGALLLVSGIAFFASVGSRELTEANNLKGRGSAQIALRNTSRNPGRSLLCVALMASASFVIVIVAANRLHQEIDVEDPTSGAGGFSLVAETDIPLLSSLEREAPEAMKLIESSGVLPYRLLPGEDVSCLNLYQPERPRLLGVPPQAIARGGFNFQQVVDGAGENPWELLNQSLGPNVIPAIGDFNSVLWILHSGLGKDILMSNERGEPIQIRLVGLLAKSVFQSELLISEAQFQHHFPSRAGYAYFLIDPEARQGSEVPQLTELSASLEEELADFGFDAVPTADKLAAFQAVENTYLSTFQTLGGLGLILGTVGMGIILLRNVLERRSELATLRAVGYRRSRLQGLVLLENALLLLIGTGIGALAGAAAIAPRLLAAGQDLPFGQLLVILLGVFAIGMLSSTLAARSVSRMPLLESLRAK